MANWQRTLKLGPWYAKARDGEITRAALAGIVAKRLITTYPELDDDLEEIVVQFESMADDETVSADEFDWVMEELYDWADVGHRLWVDTHND